MSILLPFNNVKAAYRVVSMPRRVAGIMQKIKGLNSSERVYAKAAEKYSQAGFKMAQDELKLSGQAAKVPPKGTVVQVKPGTKPMSAKVPAGKPAAPAANTTPYAKAVEANLKEIQRLANMHAKYKYEASKYLKNQRLIAKLNNDHHKMNKFNAAYARLVRAQEAFANARATWTKFPGGSGGSIASARRELEAAFGEFLAAVA